MKFIDWLEKKLETKMDRYWKSWADTVIFLDKQMLLQHRSLMKDIFGEDHDKETEKIN